MRKIKRQSRKKEAVPIEIIEKTLEKEIKRTENHLRKVSNNVEKIEEKIVKNKVEIPITRDEDTLLVVMLEELEPQPRRFYIELLKDLEDMENGMSEKYYYNQKMHEIFDLKQYSLKTYLSELAGESMIEVHNVNPFVKSKKSRKFRIIKCETELKEKILRVYNDFFCN